MFQGNENNLQILKNLHLSYFLTRNKKVSRTKILFIHTHLLTWTKDFIKLFGLRNFEILHTIRHPLAALNSQQKSWLNFKRRKLFP